MTGYVRTFVSVNGISKYNPNRSGDVQIQYSYQRIFTTAKWGIPGRCLDTDRCCFSLQDLVHFSTCI